MHFHTSQTAFSKHSGAEVPVRKRVFKMRMLVVLTAPIACAAQIATNKDSVPHVVLKEVSPLVYPALARTALIGGNVSLKIVVHPDGTIESVTAISGHRMLVPAAIESAKQSKFECLGCGESDAVEFLTYSFVPTQEADPDPCCCTLDAARPKKNEPRTVQVSQSENHIAIKAAPVCMCPNTACPCNVAWVRAHSRYRSAKCGYLWKCGTRVIRLE
jgi:TonB-like protein